jgi:hypothetical protein
MLRTLCIAAFISFTPAAHVASAEQMEANKKAVAKFYEFAVNKKDFDAAVTFLGPQHNPNAADGPEGLKAYIAFLRDKSPTHTATSSAFSPTATTSSSTSTACRLRARAVMPS